MFAPAIAVEEAAAFVSERFPGAEGVSPLARGEWSRAFVFRRAGEEWVIRFSAGAEDFAKDRVAAAFAGPDLPIPPVVAMGEAFGGAYAVSPRRPGRSFDDLSAREYGEVLPAFLRTLDAVAAVDVRGTTGYGPWRAADLAAPAPTWRSWLLGVTEGRVDARVEGWEARMGRARGARAAFDEGCRLLAPLVSACPESRQLIHADLLANNVLVEGGRVTAVLDWGNAMYGDALYDLARLIFWQPWYPALATIDLVAAARAHARARGRETPGLEARLRCYEVHVGLDAQVYNAFTERWAELERSARRTLAIARGA